MAPKVCLTTIPGDSPGRVDEPVERSRPRIGRMADCASSRAGRSDGIRVTDVWETAEQFQAFADTQIGPISQEVGIPNPPVLTFYDVHNYLTAG